MISPAWIVSGGLKVIRKSSQVGVIRRRLAGLEKKRQPSAYRLEAFGGDSGGMFSWRRVADRMGVATIVLGCRRQIDSAFRQLADILLTAEHFMDNQQRTNRPLLGRPLEHT